MFLEAVNPSSSSYVILLSYGEEEEEGDDKGKGRKGKEGQETLLGRRKGRRGNNERVL